MDAEKDSSDKERLIHKNGDAKTCCVTIQKENNWAINPSDKEPQRKPDKRPQTVSSEARDDHADPKRDRKQPNTSRRGAFRVSLSHFCVLMSRFVGVLMGNIDRLSSG